MHKAILYYWSKFFKKIKYKSIVNSEVHKTAKVEAGSSFINSRMGKYSFCGYDCEILNCCIGSFCSIANGVIIGGEMHPLGWLSMSPVFYEGRDSVVKKFYNHKRAAIKQTVIGHDVWIGQNAMIKQGVTIGVGAVIGMGSIVTKDVEPYSIVAGNPAKFIRKRFDDKLINSLLLTKWWEYSEKDLYHYAQYFTNPDAFIKILAK
jgi:acetyltransferase-like isoleucine patch superfamily enzyme